MSQASPLKFRRGAFTLVELPAASKGFTLVELLVVVGIIALLVAILMPALDKARREARQTVCLSNHHQLVIGLLSYAGDYHGYYPARYPTLSMVYNNTSPNYISNWGTNPGASDWWSYHDTFVQTYLNSPRVLQCVMNFRDPYRAWPYDAGGFVYYVCDMDIFAGWYTPLCAGAGTLPAGVSAADFPLRVGKAVNSPLTSCVLRDQWDDPAMTVAYHAPGLFIPRPPGRFWNPYGYSDGSVRLQSNHTPYFNYGWGYGYWAKR